MSFSSSSWALSPAVSWMQDAGYFRAVFLLGTVLLGVGIFAISVCSEYWHFLLAQGLCLGIGHGCLFCPTLAVLSTYFLRRRALALGIAACGSVTGGLVSRVSQYASHPQRCWGDRASCTKLLRMYLADQIGAINVFVDQAPWGL